MSSLRIKFGFLLMVSSLLAACAATTGVLPKGNGVYTIDVYRGDAGKVKLRAYQHAEKFCAEMDGKVIEVVKENMRPDPATSTMAIIDLDFKCVANNGSPMPATPSKK